MPGWATIALLAMLLSASPALVAQRMGFAIGPPGPPPAMPRGPGLTISFHARPQVPFHHQPLLFPGFYDPGFFYPDYMYSPVVSEREPATPQMVVLQPHAESPAEQKPPELLLLERQGDRFVRVRTSLQDADRASAPSELKYPVLSPNTKASSAPPAESLPVLLVFRDGRREETTHYTIANGVLYEATDYWETGSWTKSLSLATLDLSATMKENQRRGTRFQLPSGPYEVVVR